MTCDSGDMHQTTVIAWAMWSSFTAHMSQSAMPLPKSGRFFGVGPPQYGVPELIFVLIKGPSSAWSDTSSHVFFSCFVTQKTGCDRHTYFMFDVDECNVIMKVEGYHYIYALGGCYDDRDHTPWILHHGFGIITIITSITSYHTWNKPSHHMAVTSLESAHSSFCPWLIILETLQRARLSRKLIL